MMQQMRTDCLSYLSLWGRVRSDAAGAVARTSGLIPNQLIVTVGGQPVNVRCKMRPLDRSMHWPDDRFARRFGRSVPLSRVLSSHHR